MGRGRLRGSQKRWGRLGGRSDAPTAASLGPDVFTARSCSFHKALGSAVRVGGCRGLDALLGGRWALMTEHLSSGP